MSNNKKGVDEIAEVFANLAAQQTRLPPEFEAALADREELYDDAPVNPPTTNPNPETVEALKEKKRALARDLYVGMYHTEESSPDDLKNVDRYRQAYEDAFDLACSIHEGRVPGIYTEDQLNAAVAAARAETWEACAKVADRKASLWAEMSLKTAPAENLSQAYGSMASGAEEIADAIREGKDDQRI